MGPPDPAARVEDQHPGLQPQAVGDVALVSPDSVGECLALLEGAEVERPSPAELVQIAAQGMVELGQSSVEFRFRADTASSSFFLKRSRYCSICRAFPTMSEGSCDRSVV